METCEGRYESCIRTDCECRKSPIREAAEAVCVEYLGLTADAVDTEAAHIEEIIKRVLSERIICSAIRMPDGAVIMGHRHHDAMWAASKIPRYMEGEEGRFDKDQGFVTSTGRYVGREEALQIALACGQIDAPKFQPNLLFSEDLW